MSDPTPIDPNPNPNPTPEPPSDPNAVEANAAVVADVVSDVEAAKAELDSPTIQAAKAQLWSVSATARKRLHDLLVDVEAAEKVDLAAVRKAIGL